MKKKTLTTIILIAALAMVAAVTVYAVANYGTKDDPLVTSSYLQDVVQPRMEDAYRSTLDGQISEMEDQFADQVAAAGGSYVLVTLENGQTLTGRAGTEILMRTGTAAVAQSAAIDLTTGETAAVGQNSRKTTCTSCRRTTPAFRRPPTSPSWCAAATVSADFGSKSITPAHSLVRE